MNTLLDQIIIYLLCASFWFSKPVSLATVILFLSVLLCGNLIFLSNSSTFSYVLFAGLIILSFLLPDLFYFYPYILYEIQSKTTQKKQLFVLVSACAMLHFYLFPISLWLYFLLLFVLASLLQNTTEKKEYWEQKYRQTRNENYEHSYDLMEKNKALRQNQDYEIHLATLKERNRIAREIQPGHAQSFFIGGFVVERVILRHSCHADEGVVMIQRPDMAETEGKITGCDGHFLGVGKFIVQRPAKVVVAGTVSRRSTHRGVLLLNIIVSVSAPPCGHIRRFLFDCLFCPYYTTIDLQRKAAHATRKFQKKSGELRCADNQK